MGSRHARAADRRAGRDLHLNQGHSNKLEALQELARQLGLPAAAICYMGDDDIDAPGIGIVPQQAMPSALQAAA
ncbi:MAG: hypothetical protein KBC32_07650 [Candidatus Didemnitutus sp.]|nr:hypothetical protein [Candidatus Didemnitutus sp.]